MRTIDDIRRANLITLIRGFGTAAALEAVSGISASMLSQWKQGSPNSKTKKPRQISGASCRRLEAASGKPPGWMDQDHEAAEQARPPTTGSAGLQRMPSLPDALTTLSAALAEDLAPTVRESVARALAALAEHEGDPHDQEQVLWLLTKPGRWKAAARGVKMGRLYTMPSRRPPAIAQKAGGAREGGGSRVIPFPTPGTPFAG